MSSPDRMCWDFSSCCLMGLEYQSVMCYLMQDCFRPYGLNHQDHFKIQINEKIDKQEMGFASYNFCQNACVCESNQAVFM